MVGLFLGSFCKHILSRTTIATAPGTARMIMVRVIRMSKIKCKNTYIRYVYMYVYIYIYNYNYKYNPSISKYCFHPGINIIAIAALFQIRCLPFKLSTRSHKTNCHHRWESHHLMAMLGPDKSKVLQGSVAQGEHFSGSA